MNLKRLVYPYLLQSLPQRKGGGLRKIRQSRDPRCPEVGLGKALFESLYSPANWESLNLLVYKRFVRTSETQDKTQPELFDETVADAGAGKEDEAEKETITYQRNKRITRGYREQIGVRRINSPFSFPSRRNYLYYFHRK
jgi:hypothetical protein